MNRIWQPQSNEVYSSWVTAIMDEASDNLSDWENTFVISISNQLLQYKELSERQAEILERIYTEKTK